MAKFIEIPHGVGNPETGLTDRTTTLVNIESIISITPCGDYMCLVVLKGGKQFKAFRRYATLCSQLTHREADLFELYPGEEMAASYQNGYNKAKSEAEEDRDRIIKEFIDNATEWLTSNPLVDNWRSKFRKDMLSL